MYSRHAGLEALAHLATSPGAICCARPCSSPAARSSRRGSECRSCPHAHTTVLSWSTGRPSAAAADADAVLLLLPLLLPAYHAPSPLSPPMLLLLLAPPAGSLLLPLLGPSMLASSLLPLGPSMLASSLLASCWLRARRRGCCWEARSVASAHRRVTRDCIAQHSGGGRRTHVYGSALGGGLWASAGRDQESGLTD